MLTFTTIDLALVISINATLWIWVCFATVRVKEHNHLPMGGYGLALPGFIFLNSSHWNESVLRHELEHQRQMRKYSPLGVALLIGWHYGKGFLWGRIKNGSWPTFTSLWATNPLEIQANAAMNNSTPLPPLKGWQE